MNGDLKLKEMMQNLAQKYGGWQVFRDFVMLAGYAISNQVDATHYQDRENAYLSIAKKYKTQEMELFTEMFGALYLEAFNNQKNALYRDILGHIYEDLKLYNGKNGQYFTPEHICDMMAKVTAGNLKEQLKEKGYVSVGEPACGSGRMVLAFVEEMHRQGLSPQKQLFIQATDNDMTCAMMTYIALSLYGIPAIVTQGNTLTMEQFSIWYTPMFVMDAWYDKLDVGSGSKTNENTFEIPEKCSQLELFV